MSETIKKLDTEDDRIRLSGLLRNMTFQDYVNYFNDEKKAFEDLKNKIYIQEKISVEEQNLDELQESIKQLETARNIISVLMQKKSKKYNDKVDNLTEEERKARRKKDNEYKIKEPVDSLEKEKNEAKKEQKKEDKQVASLLSLGVKKEKIEEFQVQLKTGKVKSWMEFAAGYKGKETELYDA